MTKPKKAAKVSTMKQARFFMDYVAKDTRSSSGWRGIGCQMLTELPQGRKVCHEGMKDFTLTEDTELNKGQRIVTVRASEAKPITGYTIIYPLGGETGFIHPMDRQ